MIMDGNLCSLRLHVFVQMVTDGSTFERTTYAQTLDHWQGNHSRECNQTACTNVYRINRVTMCGLI